MSTECTFRADQIDPKSKIVLPTAKLQGKPIKYDILPDGIAVRSNKIYTAALNSQPNIFN
jgi:hypothetical protein